MNEIIKRLEIWRKVRGLNKSQGFEFDLNNHEVSLIKQGSIKGEKSPLTIFKAESIKEVGAYKTTLIRMAKIVQATNIFLSGYTVARIANMNKRAKCFC